MDEEASPEQAETRYAAAEEAFLVGLRSQADHEILAGLAAEAAAHATAWNSAQHAALLASTAGAERASNDRLTERTEVLAGLWADVTRAFEGLPALRDG